MRLTVRKREGHCLGTPQEIIGGIDATHIVVHNAGSEGVTLDLAKGTLDIPRYHGVTLDYHKRPPTPGIWHVVAGVDLTEPRNARNLY